jgi:hypothetical protein
MGHLESRSSRSGRLTDALALSSMADASVLRRNKDVSWDEFASDTYWSDNYQKMQAPDQEIIGLVSSFFIDALGGRPRVREAIDVGSGANLYPALLMLPWADHIQLTDYSAANVRWLRDHVADDSEPWSWQPFWQELRGREGYRKVGQPRQRLRQACIDQSGRPRVERNSLFALPAGRRWQLGTMFFVAESITEDRAEFDKAVGCFIAALEPGAPFAAAFMEGSGGYPVDGTAFPALPIGLSDVRGCLDGLASDLSVRPVKTDERVRDGYTGMIVATGLARG